MHEKMIEIKKTTTVERLEELSRIWKEVYLLDKQAKINNVIQLFENKGKGSRIHSKRKKLVFIYID